MTRDLASATAGIGAAPTTPGTSAGPADANLGILPIHTKNKLLAALSDESLRRLLPELELTPLGMRDVIFEPSAPLRYVYFPLRGLISIITVMGDGDTVETATVGNEGMAGISAFLDPDSTPSRAVAQVPGEALRLSTETLRQLIAENHELGELLRRYTYTILMQATQSVACNQLHSAEQRCARWLLMTHDRVEGNQFPMTQDFVALMLGVRRATISLAAGMLQRAGLIRYKRGKITVIDRAGLEAASCECYGVVRAEMERLLA